MHVPSSHKCAANLLAMAINSRQVIINIFQPSRCVPYRLVSTITQHYGIYLRLTYYIDHCMNLLQQQLGLPRVLVIEMKL